MPLTAEEKDSLEAKFQEFKDALLSGNEIHKMLNDKIVELEKENRKLWNRINDLERRRQL